DLQCAPHLKNDIGKQGRDQGPDDFTHSFLLLGRGHSRTRADAAGCQSVIILAYSAADNANAL
ncbi:MAG TPA: hypothetical protein PLR02_16120, partial [Rhodocyclaceae bacterium]|nr:hypothetical protein [Rhodocyclaceae bacterium]